MNVKTIFSILMDTNLMKNLLLKSKQVRVMRLSSIMGTTISTLSLFLQAQYQKI